MTDRSPYLMPASPHPDCVIEVTESRNVTGRLGPDELDALRVLAAAGLVSPQARPVARSAGRPAGRAAARARRGADFRRPKASL
jgi:hypothetical protein